MEEKRLVEEEEAENIKSSWADRSSQGGAWDLIEGVGHTLWPGGRVGMHLACCLIHYN